MPTPLDAPQQDVLTEEVRPLLPPALVQGFVAAQFLLHLTVMVSNKSASEDFYYTLGYALGSILTYYLVLTTFVFIIIKMFIFIAQAFYKMFHHEQPSLLLIRLQQQITFLLVLCGLQLISTFIFITAFLSS